MKKHKGLEDKCVWRVMYEDKKSTTFQEVDESHKLYKCSQCSGLPYTCPNYIGNNYLTTKHEIK